MSIENARIGHGFDVHKFSEQFDSDKPLILAGVTLPEQKTLLAHSDGDVVLHAVCDAILGASAAGDIGLHFPDSDAEFAGIASTELLRKVLKIAHSKGLHPINIDVTVVAQLPKLSPYRQQMVASLSNLLQLADDRVNLKATTTEGLGYIGREEGIACHAVVLMCRTTRGSAS